MYFKDDHEIKKSQVTYKDTILFIWLHLKEEKLLAFISSLLFISSVVANTVSPIYIGKLIDAALTATKSEDLISKNIMAYFSIIILLKIISPILRSLGYISVNYFSTKCLSKSVSRLSAKMQNFSTNWHVNSFAGATARKITRGSWAITDIFSTTNSTVIPALVVIIATEIVLLYKIPEIAFAFILLILIYLVISIVISSKYIRPKFRAFIKEDTELNALLNDIITGIHTVKSFATEDRENKSIRNQVETLRKKAFAAFCFADSMGVVKSLLETIIYALILYKTLVLWNQGKASIGDVTLVITISAIVISYLQNIGSIFTFMQRQFNDIEDAVEFWFYIEETDAQETAQSLNTLDADNEYAIEFKNVAFKYPSAEKNLFENLSIRIRKGEKIALVGESGSGKSSFIKILQRLYDTQGGEILIYGQNISEVTRQSIRKNISLVPQDPILFHRSLKENISYGKPDASMEEIIEAAKKAYIHDFISDLKDGYDTEVGERGIKLSGGERQRVAIARAILANRPILVLDEATSSLDSISESYIKDAIKELMNGKTSITIAHRLSTIKNSDRILVFENGKIIEQGKHKELLENTNSKYKELYEMQSLGILVD